VIAISTISQILLISYSTLLGKTPPKSSCATDKEVRAHLITKHREQETATVQPLGDEMGRVGVVARRIHRSSSHGRSHELDELGDSSWVAA
jgi:hypothetical protein